MKTCHPTLLPIACLFAATSFPCLATLEDWQNAVLFGTGPVVTHFEPVSGMAPLALDVGFLDSDRSFEFIVNAGNIGASHALMGLAGVGNQGLKFNQWQNTGVFGLTIFGEVDLLSETPTLYNQDVHVVYTSDGIDTFLYVNGELVYTFFGVALTGTDIQGLAAVTNTEGTGIVDPLDGSILGFASYDSALSPEEIAEHYNAFKTRQPTYYLDRWQQEVAAGTPPMVTHFEPVSGRAPLIIDIGDLDGPRSVEFIVNAGGTGASAALLGRGGIQGLKFEQWNNTGTLGLTQFGVADYDSFIPSPFNTPVQIAFASDGTVTHLYLNGERVHTFEETALEVTGQQGLAAAWREFPQPEFRDHLPGRILGFASYADQLSEEEIALHATAALADEGAEVFAEWQQAVGTGTSPTYTHFEPVDGSNPVLIDVGTLEGPRTFEFIVNATGSSAAAALMGSAYAEDGRQNLKFEQWNDTGSFGITIPQVIDHNSGVPHPDGYTAHVVYTSDGVDTWLYVDGELQYIFYEVPLTLTGRQALGAELSGFQPTFYDILDGHILGFASYNAEVSAEEFAQHYAAFIGASGSPADDFAITAVNRNTATGEITLTWQSEPSASYQIRYSENLATFDGVAVATVNGAANATTTTHTFANPNPSAPRLFFRVVRTTP